MNARFDKNLTSVFRDVVILGETAQIARDLFRISMGALEYVGRLGLLDANGEPFSSHIERVLRELAPRVVRQFPTLKDEAVLAEVLEEAGRKIAEHERRAGPIEKLHGYAWVAIRSVATSRMRRGSMRMERGTLRSDESEVVLSGMPSDVGTADDIERAVLLDEILARLSPEERSVCMWKKAGFSSKEIAQALGSSPAAVDTLFYRVKDKVQMALGVNRRGLSVSTQRNPPRKSMLKATLSDKAADKANG